MVMKKIFIPTLVIATLFASCAKEAKVSNESGKSIEIRGTIDNQEVDIDKSKSSYDISGSTASFYWTGTETIGRLWYTSNPSFGEDPFTSTTSADSKETSLIFSGEYSSNQTAYAFYPKWTKDGEAGPGWSSNPFQIYLSPTLPYDSSDPLKGIVPMLGKLVSDEFVFTPITGIIAVSVTNIPSAARSVSLSSTTRLSGNFLVANPSSGYADGLDGVITNGITITSASGSNSGWYNKTYTFSSQLDKTEHVFYFPVPVGDIDGITISIKDENGEVIQTISNAHTITTTKATITKFPSMDLEKGATVAFTGDATAPSIYVSEFKGTGAKIRYAVAETDADAKTGVTSSLNIISSAGIDAKGSLSTGLTQSGKYYLCYQVLNSSDEAILTRTMSFYFLNATDKQKYVGTYTFSTLKAFTVNATSSWIDITSKSNTMTVAISDDPTKGLFMLTDFIGFNYSGTMTNTSLCGEGALITPTSGVKNFNGTYGAGSPQYGYFNDSGWLVFRTQNPFFTLDGESYYICHGESQYVTFGFTKIDNGSRITLTGTSTNNTACFVQGASFNTGSGSNHNYASSEILAKFGGSAPVAYKDY